MIETYEKMGRESLNDIWVGGTYYYIIVFVKGCKALGDVKKRLDFFFFSLFLMIRFL